MSINSLLMRFYYKTRKFIGCPVENPDGRHLQNLMKGEILEIEGRKFVRVNLRIVDTLNIDSTKILFNLETENEMLKEVNLKLHVQNNRLKQRVKDIEMLNINLTKEIDVQSKIFESQKKKLHETWVIKEEELNEKVANYLQKLKTEKQKVKEKLEAIKNKNIENHHLKNIISQKEKENKVLLSALLANSEQIKKAEDVKNLEIKALEIDEKELRKELEVIQDYIREKESFIRTLSERLIQKEKKINELETLLNSIENKTNPNSSEITVQ